MLNAQDVIGEPDGSGFICVTPFSIIGWRFAPADPSECCQCEGTASCHLMVQSRSAVGFDLAPWLPYSRRCDCGDMCYHNS